MTKTPFKIIYYFLIVLTFMFVMVVLSVIIDFIVQSIFSNRIQDRTVKVITVSKNNSRIGTGIFLDHNKILTAFHLVEGANQVVLIQNYNSILLNKANLLKSDKKMDLAVLVISKQYFDFPVLKFKSDFSLYEKVCAYGMPNEAWVKNCGRVTDFAYAKNHLMPQKLLLQISPGVVYNGFSGGPVFQNEKVLGIINSMDHSTKNGYAITTLDIIPFLKNVKLGY